MEATPDEFLASEPSEIQRGRSFSSVASIATRKSDKNAAKLKN